MTLQEVEGIAAVDQRIDSQQEDLVALSHRVALLEMGAQKPPLDVSSVFIAAWVGIGGTAVVLSVTAVLVHWALSTWGLV